MRRRKQIACIFSISETEQLWISSAFKHDLYSSTIELTSEDFPSLPLLCHKVSDEIEDNETFDAPDNTQ